jgi:hypothetical protein
LCSPTEATNRQRPSHTGSIAFFAAWSYIVLSCSTACSAPRKTAESNCVRQTPDAWSATPEVTEIKESRRVE